MKLRYTRPALADLDSILDYIAHRSPQGAGHIHARVQVILNLLLSHPRIGVQTDDESIRRIATTPYPYLIFYEISGDEIVVHAVRHSARKPSDMPGSST